MLSKFLCLVSGHRVERRKVRYDGHKFHGRCRRCQCRLERAPTGWVPEQDKAGEAIA